ncbi:MAG: TetR/AcrR family transcriptional regulator [Deltaproteobacteria bacterium]|nr:TetR/AcrR family transcriptional regulator [Deltaproteobacteria bacterium]
MSRDRLRTDSARTREALLDAAEQLFATQGISAVSLRAINSAAGARNVSAAHYHFGSKDGVVAAVAARRMAELARNRLDALERAAAGGAPDLRALVEAIVLPFVRLLADDAQQAAYVAFLARLAGEVDAALETFAPPAFWKMIDRLTHLLQRALPNVPPRVLLLRVRFLLQQTFVLVTDLQRLARKSSGRIGAAELDTIGIDFVDYLVGGLSAASRSAEGASAARTRARIARPRPRQPARQSTTRGSRRRNRP